MLYKPDFEYVERQDHPDHLHTKTLPTTHTMGTVDRAFSLLANCFSVSKLPQKETLIYFVFSLTASSYHMVTFLNVIFIQVDTDSQQISIFPSARILKRVPLFHFLPQESIIRLGTTANGQSIHKHRLLTP